jgi:hypothetical protein
MVYLFHVPKRSFTAEFIFGRIFPRGSVAQFYSVGKRVTDDPSVHIFSQRRAKSAQNGECDLNNAGTKGDPVFFHAAYHSVFDLVGILVPFLPLRRLIGLEGSIVLASN